MSEHETYPGEYVPPECEPEQVECPVCHRETAYAFRGACEECMEGPAPEGMFR